MTEIRVAGDGDLDAYGALRVQCYGFPPGHGAESAALIRGAGLADRVLLAVDGAAIVGALVVLPFGQFWRGRPVPTGGVGSVVVLPERRGQGVGVALMDAACRAMRSRGEVLSVLGPATMALYRSCGWEMAGKHGVQRVPTADLAQLAPTSLRERAATPDDHDAIKRVYLHAARPRNGMLARPAFVWSTRLAERPGRYAYVVERNGTVDGYVIYTQHKRGDQAGYHLIVEDLAAGDWESECALWRHVGAHRAQASHAIVHAPTEALALNLREQALEWVWSQHWMLRVVDLAGAVRARGFPLGLTASVPLTVIDDQVASNRGDWVLDVGDGRGAVTRGAGGGPVLTANALAALFSGFASTAVLSSAGGVVGGAANELATLDAAFAGQPAVFNDDF